MSGIALIGRQIFRALLVLSNSCALHCFTEKLTVTKRFIHFQIIVTGISFDMRIY